MTSDEIKEIRIGQGGTPRIEDVSWIWLKEIAYQLAVINESQRIMVERSDTGEKR